MTLETTLKNSKGEAFNSLIHATKEYCDLPYLHKDNKELYKHIQEVGDIHNWKVSLWGRLILNTLNEKGYELNYLK